MFVFNIWLYRINTSNTPFMYIMEVKGAPPPLFLFFFLSSFFPSFF